MISTEEAIKMQGVEFTYIFEDGDSIPAYVKKFDPETGKLTCYSLEAETEEGGPLPQVKTRSLMVLFAYLLEQHWKRV
jgi:hypothetical protein